MKLSIINAAAGILGGIKLNKISDKKIKTALLKDYLMMRNTVKQAGDDQQEIVHKFQDDWADELAKVEAFRKENKPVVGHDEYLDAERDANKAIQAVFSQEVELGIVPVKMDDFMGAISRDEEITFEQIALLEECGIIEE